MYVTNIVIIISIVAYLGLTAGLTYILRSRTNLQFMVGSRVVPAIVVGVLLMSEFIGSKTTIGLAQSAFENGIAAGWALYSAGIAFLLLCFFFVKQMYGSGEYTISGIIEQRFGKATKILVSLMMIYALLIVNVGNFITGAAALGGALNVGFTSSILIIAVVGTFTTLFGGLKGLAYVNILHSTVKVTGIALVLWFALKLTGGVGPIRDELPDFYFTWDGHIGLGTIVAWTIGNVGALFSTQYVVQAIASNKDTSAARRSTLYSAAFCIPIGLALAFIGICARFLYPDMDSLYALPIFIEKMSTPLAAWVSTSLVASVLVAVSTVALAMTSLIVRDFYAPYKKPTEDQEFRATKIIALFVGFAPVICVFFAPQILELSFFSRALRLPITVVALMGVYAPMFATSRGAVGALISAVVMTSIWYFLDNPFGIDNMFVALFVPLVVMLIDRLFSSGDRGGPSSLGVADGGSA